ncbi:MAG: 4Fe-4S binding protein, partial [Proteobacteria bacterium]|nr:4Fe-4S binding protein [Pseudomonadota bacterium]
MTKRIGILYFSPTNTTKQICSAVALGMGMRAKDSLMLDITLPEIRASIIANPHIVTDNIDHLIVGSPVHSGKLPLQVLECLRSMDGNGKECSAIVVYGNRDYGIALYSMVELLSENGFSITAAGAFIGQHSYSDIVPVALGRPDDLDIEKARQFGIKSLSTSRYLSLKNVSIHIDKISKSEKYSSIKPVHIEKKCIGCGQCAKRCPVGLLSSYTGLYLNREAKEQCIGCMACVHTCMQKAKVAKVNLIVKLVMKI